MSDARTALSVLVVEDNAADAELALEALADDGGGVRVEVAKTGRDALERLAQAGGVADLILLDLNLPRQTGLDTLADLKRDPDLARIPVVVLTTSKSAREIARSYELGAAAVLNKPMRLHDYRAMLASFRSFWVDHVRFAGEAA